MSVSVISLTLAFISSPLFFRITSWQKAENEQKIRKINEKRTDLRRNFGDNLKWFIWECRIFSGANIGEHPILLDGCEKLAIIAESIYLTQWFQKGIKNRNIEMGLTFDHHNWEAQCLPIFEPHSVHNFYQFLVIILNVYKMCFVRNFMVIQKFFCLVASFTTSQIINLGRIGLAKCWTRKKNEPPPKC